MKIQTVLTVDDNEAEHYIIEDELNKYNSNIIVHRAFDGQEALDIISTQGVRPDLILLDINMPGLDGFGFLEKCSAMSEKMVCTVAMLSSSENVKDRERCAEFECVVGFIVKPLSQESLADIEEKLPVA